MLRRTHKGLVLIGIVVAFLLAAPTVAFWLQEGLDAVIAFWISAGLLAVMAVYGIYLMVTDRDIPANDSAYRKGVTVKRRAHRGFFLICLVGLILIFAPTVVFWMRYGWEAVLAHWASLVVLAVMLTIGCYLILTDRIRAKKK